MVRRLDQRVVDRIVASFAEFERAWLDPLDEPVVRAIERSEWVPDDPGAYCDRCGATVGPHEEQEFGCSACVGTRPPWSRFVRLGEYEPPLSDLVLQLKFHRKRQAGRLLGERFAQVLEASGAMRGVEPGRAAVVPVPMSRRRFLERGIDHTGEIAKALAGGLHVSLARGVATRHHPSQRSVPASGRRGNVRGRYRARKAAFKGIERVFLVDDVVTTGSTVREVCRAMREAGSEAEIWVCAVSVAE